MRSLDAVLGRRVVLGLFFAGNETTGPLYLDHPKFEGFEVKQTVTRPETAAA